MAPPRPDPRAPRASAAFAARRRADALARARAARAGVADAVRAAKLVGQGAEPERREPEPAPAPARSPRPPRPPPPRGPLTTHEWLTDPPDDLGTSWIVLSRPEGVRVTLEAGGGRTLARAAGGRVLHEFPSRLPGGSPATVGGPSAGCVLDCVFQADGLGEEEARGGGFAAAPPSATPSTVGGTFHALDVLEWAGVDMAPCTADMRLFWLGPKLAECGAAGDPLLSGARVVPLPHAPATASSLSAAARAPVPCVRDGVLLLHAEGAYERGAANPLALVWKDALCSRHPVDTGPGGVAAPMQTATLRVGADGATVETGDDPPVALATAADLPPPGALARFIVGPEGFAFTPDGAPAGADLAPAPGPPPRARARRADAFSKLLFQAAARAGTGVTLEMLCEAAGASAAAGGMEVG
jgi:snurportin-1